MIKSAIRVNLIVEREKECEGEGKIWNSDQMHTHTAIHADVCLRSGSHVLCLQRLLRIASMERQSFHATHMVVRETLSEAYQNSNWYQSNNLVAFPIFPILKYSNQIQMHPS